MLVTVHCERTIEVLASLSSTYLSKTSEMFGLELFSWDKMLGTGIRERKLRRQVLYINGACLELVWDQQTQVWLYVKLTKKKAKCVLKHSRGSSLSSPISTHSLASPSCFTPLIHVFSLLSYSAEMEELVALSWPSSNSVLTFFKFPFLFLSYR